MFKKKGHKYVDLDDAILYFDGEFEYVVGMDAINNHSFSIEPADNGYE